MKKVIAIIGARPQFIKHYAFEVVASLQLNLVSLHTGQHYDKNMSQVFFDQLGMKAPDHLLNLGGGNHGYQTGRMLIEIEKIILKEVPDAVLVYGDTNSTLAGALVASKLQIPLIHVEAGLRSYNKEMPEEINRLLTDHISDLLFVPSPQAKMNLYSEGIKKGVIEVGDIMKDLLEIVKKNRLLEERPYDPKYYYVTLHRPYNVDEEKRLISILDALHSLDKKVIFSIHPRTRDNINKFNINFKSNYSQNIELIDPQPYFENINFLFHSDGLITDSGGMQKEAYWLKKKCVTIRKETEWIETLNDSCNTLLFENLEILQSQLSYEGCKFDSKLYGDGNTSQLIVDHIIHYLNSLN